MPIVFLSPSTQDWNPYVTGSGSEEYWVKPDRGRYGAVSAVQRHPLPPQ